MDPYFQFRRRNENFATRVRQVIRRALALYRLTAVVDLSVPCSSRTRLAAAQMIATFDILPEQQARHAERQFPDAFCQGNRQRRIRRQSEDCAEQDIAALESA